MQPAQRNARARGAVIMAASVALISVCASAVLAGPFAYVPNYGSGDVSVIDTATNTVVQTIAVGAGPNTVAIDPDATRVYVVNAEDHTVSVIDTATQMVATTVPVCTGQFIGAAGVALTGDGSTAYVGCGFPVEIYRMDTTTFAKIPASIGNSFDFVQGLAVDVAAGRLYAQLRDDFGGGARLIGIDAATLAVVASTSMQSDFFTSITLPLGPAVSTSGARVYAPHPNGDVVRVYEAAADTVRTIALPSRSYAVSLNQSATIAYVSLGNSSVAVIDAVDESLITTIPVGSTPRGLSLSPDEATLYVANAGDGNVSVIDTASNTVTSTIPVGDLPIAIGRFIARPPVCGDGTVAGDEVCDAGDQNGTDASCCAIDCTPARSGLSCADDHNPCTSEICDAAGTCQHTPQAGSCDDRIFCNGADSCADGTCSVHAGDPCIFGSPCNNSCDESTDGCRSPDLAPCDRGSGVGCAFGDRCRNGVCTDEGGGDSDGDLVCTLSDNCPETPNPTQTNADDDRMGDACDPCFNPGGARTFRNDPNPALMIWRSGRVQSTNEFDMTRLSADFRLPPRATFSDLPLLSNGARIVFTYSFSTTPLQTALDAVLPGGMMGTTSERGWRLGSGGRRWLYRDRSDAPIGGIRHIALTDRSHIVSGLVRIRMRGAGHLFQAAELANDVIVTLGGAESAATGVCGESAYDHCAFDAGFRRWTCEGR